MRDEVAGPSGSQRWAKQIAQWKQRLLRRSSPPEQGQVAYRRLAAQLHLDLPRNTHSRSALVLSPHGCVWGAAGALGLANYLGRELSQPVLLVDANPQSAQASQLLECTGLPGWGDLLSGSGKSAADLILPTSSDYVSFMPAGRPGLQGIGGEELAHLTEQLRASYDFVLFAGGGVLDGFTALDLLQQMGCVLLMVAENETRVEDMQAARQTLAMWRAPNVRLVLTAPSHEQVSSIHPRTTSLLPDLPADSSKDADPAEWPGGQVPARHWNADVR